MIRAALPLVLSGIVGGGLAAQSTLDGRRAAQGAGNGNELRLRRLSLFSSGVGFFEHTGIVSGAAELSLPFGVEAVNDALKSLVVNDPDASPAVSYPSEQTLMRTLRSLSVDILGNPNVPALLDSLKGAEIEVALPAPVRGRIIFVEYRMSYLDGENRPEPYLSLATEQGIRTIAFKEITGFTFKDPALNADLNRALDLIMASRDADTRRLTVRLSGSTRREVSLSYVIPTPVWKVSYRLDLAQDAPFLQGWAIVDNDGDTDWDNVSLSLVTGRPVSFIQNLYPPYHVRRPTVPLAIAGAAEAHTYDSGQSEAATDEVMEMLAEESYAMKSADRVTANSLARAPSAAAPRPAPTVAGGSAETAAAQAAGDWFEFTIQKPVTLPRRQSAMLPLIEGTIPAVKTLVFSGARATPGRPMNPAIGAELTNSTGMKLPAGPITVYDGGTYAGDALIEFFPEGEKRLIAYGDDLSVTGTITASSNRFIAGVTIQQGIMTITRKLTSERTYSFRNAASEPKRLIVEHPITFGATLTAPRTYSEKTDTLYRFVQNLGQRGTLEVTVQEERPLSETIMLSQLSLNSFLGYTTNQEIAPEVREALQAAVALKQKIDEAKQQLTDLQNRRNRLTTEQERTRRNLEAIRNLEAAGNQSQQGQDYLKRLFAQDAEIDSVDATIADAEQAVRTAQKDYDTYLGTLTL